MRILNRRDLFYVIDDATEVVKHVSDQATNMPIRKLRFFREYFGYPNLLQIFKDNSFCAYPAGRQASLAYLLMLIIAKTLFIAFTTLLYLPLNDIARFN